MQTDPEYRDALPDGPGHRRAAGPNPGNRFESQRLHVPTEACMKPGHDRRRGEGPRAEQIAQAFELYCRKFGLNRDVRPLTTDHFRPPATRGQMSLFPR